MPNKPISIEFTAETDKYERELRKAEKATDRLADTIDDVPKSTDRMADEAAKDFDRLGGEAADAGRETAQEFQSNLGEAISSGSMEDLVQGTLGGLVGSLAGPLGLAAAGVAGVAGLAFAKLKEDWEKTQEAIATQTTSMWGTILAGIEGQVGESFARINKQTVITEELDRLWNEDPEGMLKLVEASEQLGINARDVVRARAGDEEALRRVKGAADDVLETMDLTSESSVEQIDNLRLIQKGWEVSEQAVGKAKTMVDAYNSSVGDVVGTIAQIPREIPITIKVDKSSLTEFSGGAYALSGGGRLTAVYGTKAGASG